jgi:hypothetical protein
MGGFADYYGHSNFHPLGFALVCILGLATLCVRRQHALIPILIAVCLIPMAQRIVIGGLDLTFLRILILISLLRLLIRREWREFKWDRLDTAVLLWSISGTLIMTIQLGTIGAFIYRLGWSFDLLGGYFIARCLVRSWEDIMSLSRSTAILSVPVAGAFLYEWNTQHNLFSIFGGVPQWTDVREGKLRCQGAFPHAILAGTFWATCLPLIWMLWVDGARGRRLAMVGTVAALFIIFTTSSSTPILSVMAAFLGIAFYRLRHHRRLIWVGTLGLLFALHLVMNNPVWHLMARVDVIGGSTGWHRFYIFDTFIRNFSKWYLIGEPDPLSWGVWQMRDITNQYMIEGLRGGLITLVIFTLALIFAFGNVGKLLTLNAESGDQSLQWKIWLLGVAILIHVFTFFGLSYFGQNVIPLYFQIALIGSAIGFSTNARSLVHPRMGRRLQRMKVLATLPSTATGPLRNR